MRSEAQFERLDEDCALLAAAQPGAQQPVQRSANHQREAHQRSELQRAEHGCNATKRMHPCGTGTDDLTVRGKYTRSHGSTAYPVAYQRNALAAMAARESNYKRGGP